MIKLGKKHFFGLREFHDVVFKNAKIQISQLAEERLKKTRHFVDYLLKNNIKVYGLTTGFADLRNKSVSPDQAAQLSCNLIESHDAGIGPSLPKDVILGAMVVRASSLAKGHSGFQINSLQTLVEMTNHQIIPFIPKTGSLGASGDLAFLARMGRAMMGKDVPVWFEGQQTSACKALKKVGIAPFMPLAKEGLAVTNGTSFMISMLAIAFLKEYHELENILALQGLFLNAVGATKAAFNQNIQEVRDQKGQEKVAEILSRHFASSPFVDPENVQDDYCIRCLPQILGPKIEIILEQQIKIERELNAVTDNPLFFENEEITPDVDINRIFSFENDQWAVLSGGNFHGECITTIADTIATANAKIALTLERQITFLLNPFRNKNKLPCYLITDQEHLGLLSGYMITQYTANALTQKIAHLGTPTSIYNITSANESEDIVSYGATAAERLLEQQERMHELFSIYLTVVVQAYSIVRNKWLKEDKHIPSELIAEKIFQKIQACTQDSYPFVSEESFERRYEQASEILTSGVLRSLMEYPLSTIWSKQSQVKEEKLDTDKATATAHV